MAMKLNPQQKKAVEYTSGPCLVLAGAGSGKTRVITEKIAYLIRHCHLSSQQIVALTFTNKAAREMKQRVGKLLDKHEVRGLQVSTFHTFGLNFIRREYKQAGLRSGFTLFDDHDQLALLKELTHKADMDNERLDNLKQQINRWKSGLCSPEHAIKTAQVPQDMQHATLYQLYEGHLRAYNAVDFDDLIALPCQILQSQTHIRDAWQNRIRYILIDEYQDTNISQYRLVRLLIGERARFTVVGDDDQSIYAWRGANPDNLKQLSQDYRRLEVIKLEQNYRSKQRILRCANTLIAHNSHLFEKKLFSTMDDGEPIRVLPAPNESSEAELIVSEILTHKFNHRTRLGDYAVLYRSNYQARELENAFTQNRIAYKISGGGSFFARTEIKDIMAYLRLVVNPDDDSAFLRVVNVPRREIGPSTLEKLGTYAKSRNKSLFAASFEIGLEQYLQGRGLNHLREFVHWLVHLEDRAKREEPEPLLVEILAKLNYQEWLQDNAPSMAAAQQRWQNVEMLLGWIKKMIEGDPLEAGVSLAEAVNRLTLREVLERGDEEQHQDEVQLMTLHAAKGLEFPFVFIIGFEEGILPHQNSTGEQALEEERRLAYVGITRAQRQLTFTYCKERKAAGENVNPAPSCFLTELPEDDLAWQHQKPETTPQQRMKIGQAGIASVRSLLNAK